MKYEHFNELPELIAKKLITGRKHPNLPLTIYNYTAQGQHLSPSEWTEAMKDCRGLILDDEGNIVGRPFRKFWNLEQVPYENIPAGDFKVWEKLDGSLGIVCSYAGEIVVATRGSFESDQAKWFKEWLDKKHKHFTPSGETYLFEIIYPNNRIVVDYGDRKEAVLLAVLGPDAADLWAVFEMTERFNKARLFDGLKDFNTINTDTNFAGEEGFVVQWQNGFRAKVKLEEYKRLHRLITQCSTRTIWELLRAGKGVQELVDRVPEEFAQWVNKIAGELYISSELLIADTHIKMSHRPADPHTRKDFALWAMKEPHPPLLFALLDGKDITDSVWKLVEPAWATPFRKEAE